MSDTQTLIAVGLAAGAVVLALLAITIVVARGREHAGRRVVELTEANARLEERLDEVELALENVDLALERAHDRGTRISILAGLRESIDLDVVVERILSAAASIERVNAAMIALLGGATGSEKEPLIASVGLTAEEVEAQPVGSSPQAQASRAVSLTFRYETADQDDEAVRGGLAVPLRDESGLVIGAISVYWRGRAWEPTRDQMEFLEDVAAAAGPAIEHARSFRRASVLVDIDPLTGLHNRRAFHEALARDVARAHRYKRRLALVIIDLDDLKAINDRIGHLAGDTVLAEAGQQILSVVRGTDLACRIGGDEFAVIMPEATLRDAEQLSRRLQFAVASRPPGSSERLSLSAGVAELVPDDDAMSLFERADAALYRAKAAGKARSMTAEASA